MVFKSKRKREAYQKKWREENPDYHRKYNRKYYLENREKILEYHRELHKNLSEKQRQKNAATKREWRHQHPEEFKVRYMRWNQNKKVRYQAYRRMHVDNLGGHCQNCGYNRLIWILELHHIDPTKQEYRNEVLKKNIDYSNFILLCPTCHKEFHRRLNELPDEEKAENKIRETTSRLLNIMQQKLWYTSEKEKT